LRWRRHRRGVGRLVVVQALGLGLEDSKGATQAASGIGEALGTEKQNKQQDQNDGKRAVEELSHDYVIL
jgi:hypothetical protein